MELTDWEIKKEGSRIVLFSKAEGFSTSGIRIDIIKCRSEIEICAWYDDFVGIKSRTLKLDDLLKLFETPKRVKRRVSKL